ncbi:MAG: autotransporter outer membrane beta-barrel domain-containing protein, partial [Alphaproteobacteria bacterium]|nr:autotransporter outer membrane beta-barrel domain-containing protein [Alphaproteobacteria bacterium]
MVGSIKVARRGPAPLLHALRGGSSIAVLGLVFAGAAPALATDWNGATSNDWFTGANWSAGVPASATDVTIHTVTPNPTVIGTAGAQARNVFVGLFGSVGDLTIRNGGTLANFDSHIASDSGSTGAATVSGAGSDWTSAGNFYIGDFGNGTLTIEGGASASGNFTFIAAAVGSTGKLTVTGPGSSFSSTNNLSVGSSGNGALEIQGGATVSDTLGLIGVENGSIGVATVDGPDSSWNNSSDLYVGVHGAGTLTIKNGGSVSNVGGQIGINADSTGTATVEGAGSSWTNSGDLVVGRQGEGTLDILSGGAVTNASGSIGDQPGSSGTVTVDGANSSWTNSGNLWVGNFGTGALTIHNGGAVSNIIGAIGNASTGTVTVEGAGSSWINSGSLYVGLLGTGSLTVQNGGAVSSAFGYIGYLGGSTGTVTLDGAGSSWTVDGAVNVANAGNGTLTVRNGALVDVGTTLTIASASGSTGTVNIGAAAGDAATAAGTLSAGQVTFGQGSGTLVFNHTSASYDFATPLSGDGSVRQLAGFTNLTGSSAGFTGATTVEGGTLAVNGSLGGALDVLAAGRLQGGGTVGDTVVAGTVAPGNSIGPLNVAGDIEFKAGSTYEVEVDAAGQGDRIAATGVEVLNAPGTYVVGTRYTILTAASGLTGTFSDLTQGAPLSTPFLSFTLDYDASAADLDVTRSDLAFGSIGATPNQKAVGGGLDSLPLSSPLLNAVSQLDTASVQSALDQLSGEIHASVASALVEDSHFVRDAATERLRSAFDTAGATGLPVMSYASGGPDLVPATTDRLAVWGQGFGSWGHAGDDGNSARLSRSTGGFFIGADGVAFETWRLGLLAGYSRTDFDVADRGSSGESDSYH